jgi:hypothetical protein
MGVNIKETKMNKFDVLKDLELARANLNEKGPSEKSDQNIEILNILPLEKIKFTECKSDSSGGDFLFFSNSAGELRVISLR